MSKVAVLKTSPGTVVEDYGRLMRSVGYQKAIPKETRTVLKLNLSWTLFYPSCSTPQIRPQTYYDVHVHRPFR